jgi:WD40 repeat protein
MRNWKALSLALMLMAAVLACSLSVDGQNKKPTPIGPPTASLIPTGSAPSVTVIEPAEGAQFSVGQEVRVRARAIGSTPITQVELVANSQRVDLQPMTDAATGEVILTYRAQNAGQVALSVRAYSGSTVGTPAQRNILIVSGINPGGGVNNTPIVSGPTGTPNMICRARTNVGINFRKGPGTEYEVLTTFAAGQELPIRGYADRPDGRWWQAANGAVLGWLKTDLTTQLGDCSSVRPAAVPASPTPVVTNTPPPTIPGITPTLRPANLYFSQLTGDLTVTLGADGTVQKTYTIAVKNNGQMTSPQFVVAAQLPNGQTQNFDVPGLNPNQEFLVPSAGLNVTFTQAGTARLIVHVDPNNTVPEADENDNIAYLEITVNPASQSSAPAVSTAGDTALVSHSNSGALAVLQGHGGAITGLAFDPQGYLLASASMDGTVRLWNVASQSEQLVLSGHMDRVTSVAFNPAGTLLASGSWDGTVIVWDVATGAQVTSFNHGAEVNSVAFSPDGSLVVSGGMNPGRAGGGDGAAVIWDLATGAHVADIWSYGMVTGVDYDNQLVIASAGSSCARLGGVVEIYNADGSQAASLEGHSGWIAALSANAGLIAGGGQAEACTGNGTVWIWSAASGAIAAILDQGAAAVTGVAINSDGNLLATSGSDGNVRLWEISSGTILSTWSGHTSEATAIAFSVDGSLVASGGMDSTVRLWHVA